MGLLSAVASIAGGLIDRSETRHSAKSQYEYNNALQNSNMDFQRELAKNKIQWAVEDGLKAGINPAVAMGQAGTGGANASQTTSAGNTSTLGTSAVKNIQDNLINKQNADTQQSAMESQKQLNEANRLKALTEANLMPRNTAVQETIAQAKVREVEQMGNKINAEVEQIRKMLPAEYQDKVEEIGIKAYQNRLNKRELDVLNNTGLTLSEWKGLGKEITDVGKFILGAKIGGSAIKNGINRSIAIESYGRNGQFTGAKKILYGK